MKFLNADREIKGEKEQKTKTASKFYFSKPGLQNFKRQEEECDGDTRPEVITEYAKTLIVLRQISDGARYL